MDMQATSHAGDSRLAVLAAAVGRHPVLALTPSGPVRASLAAGLAYVLPDASELPVPLVAVKPTATERDLTGTLRIDPRKKGEKTHLGSGKLTSANGGVLHLLDAAAATNEQDSQIREAYLSGEVAFEVVSTRQRVAREARFHLFAGASGCACTSDQGTCACTWVEYTKQESKIPPKLRGLAQIMVRDAADPGQFGPADIELVAEARLRSRRRLAGTRYAWNGDVGSAREVTAPGRTWWAAQPAASATFQKIARVARTGLMVSWTGQYTVLSLAWSLADLRGLARPGTVELLDALRLHRPELTNLVDEQSDRLS